MSAAAWLREHWKPIAVVGAGALGLYLLMQRQGGGAPAADSSALPATGPPPQGDQTPQYFSPAEQVAAGLSQSELFRQQLQANSAAALFGGTPAGVDAGGHQEYNYGGGQISKAWQQVVVNGQQMWEDIYHPGHIITEQQAQQLAPQDHGPYASGANKITLGSVLGGIAGSLTSLAASGSPITLGNLFKPSASIKPASSGARPVGTPGIAPTPRYGNPPAPTAPGSIMESI